jgi:hypothetical protein
MGSLLFTLPYLFSLTTNAISASHSQTNNNNTAPNEYFLLSLSVAI